VTANSTPGATASERDEAAKSTTAKSTSATATTSTTASAADASAKGRTDTTRRVKLTLSRVDPFSVLKISFLLSVALGIAAVVAVAVLWGMLNGMGVFSTITESVNELQSGAQSGNKVDIGDWFSFGRGARPGRRVRRDRRHPADRDRDPDGVRLQRLRHPAGRRAGDAVRRLICPRSRFGATVHVR
jgi:hypothetical protein